MHGECKVPGGKLVAADAQVRGGRLAGVRVNGDFPREPDEVPERINATVTGSAVRRY